MTKYVKYVGTSHWREITEAQWAALEPPVENITLRWDAANGWTVPADKVSEDAWPYIDADSELVVIDKDYRQTTSTEDTAPADTSLYPPQTTAKQADELDAQAAAMNKANAASSTEGDGGASAAENALPDQQPGSVEGPVDKD